MPNDLTLFANMAGYVCWKTGTRLSEVLSADAMTMGSENFLPTHVRRSLRRVENTNTNNYQGDVAATDMLREFLSPDKSHHQSVVIGTSGRGKSRVIRWLAIHAPETSTRRVVLIDKSDLNLRGVIGRVLEGMQGVEFDAYRNQLQYAPVVNNAANAPTLLLDALSLAVNATSPNAGEVLPDADAQERRELLMKRLPPLLSDPRFREVFVEKRPIVRALVEHAVGNDRSEQREQLRAFVPDDFAVREWHLYENELNANARPMFQQLSKQEYRVAAADWINRNLPDALAKLLNFDQTDLGQLFLGVRRSLKKQGRELILLIEDFARMQGIDRALLDAVNDVASPENDLCPLRCVVAMTTGIYDGLPDTFKTRTDPVLSVDLLTDSADDERRSIAAFHLNVLRHDPDAVGAWNRETVELAHEVAEGDNREMPSACDGCLHKEPCHTTFGSYQTRSGAAIGYYPFTDNALRELYSRVKEDKYNTFNPRKLLAQVLYNSLQNGTEAVRDKRWMPSGLVSQFGVPRMPPGRRDDLKAITSKIGATEEEKTRYENLFEVYGDYNNLSGVAPELFAAFALRPIEFSDADEQKEREVEERKKKEDEEKGERKPTVFPEALAETISLTNDWGNGAAMVQDTVNAIRRSLFPHIKQSVAWDTMFLGETFHVGESRYFQPPSLYFEGQIPIPSRSTPLIITVERDDAAGVVAALLLDHHRNWEFDATGGQQHAFYELITMLGNKVITHLQRTSTSNWLDPAPLAAELLLLDALYTGAYNTQSEKKDGLRGDELFLELILDDAPTNLTVRPFDAKTTKLFSDLHQKRDALRELLWARIASTKGSGTNNPAFIDAARVRHALSEVAKRWTPQNATRPTVTLGAHTGAYRDLFDLRDRLLHDLPAVMETAREDMRYLLDIVATHFGDDVSAQGTKDTIAEMRKASEAASGGGVWRPATPGTRDAFNTALDSLESIPLGRLRSMRERASNDVLDAARAVPLLLHPVVHDVVTKSAQFALRADTFLSDTATQVEIEQNRLQNPDAADAENRAAIGASLDTLVVELEELSKIAYAEANNA